MLKKSRLRERGSPGSGIAVGLVVLLLLAGGGAAWYGGFFRGHGAGEDVEGEKYTCGMHPWIITDKPGDCPICGMKLTRIEKQPDAAKPAASRGFAAEEGGGRFLRGHRPEERREAGRGAQDALLPQPDERDGHVADAGEGRDGHGLRPRLRGRGRRPRGGGGRRGAGHGARGRGRPAPLGGADRAGRPRDRRPDDPHRGDRGPGRDAGPPASRRRSRGGSSGCT